MDGKEEDQEGGRKSGGHGHVQAEKKEAGHRRLIHPRSHWTYLKSVSALKSEVDKHFRSLHFPSHAKY